MIKQKVNTVMATKEKSTTPTTAVQQYTPSLAMQALFAAPAKLDAKKLVRLNMPQLIKPGDVPIGGMVSGKIIKVIHSPVKTIKGKLLWLQHENGTEFMFPATGVIRAALAPGVQDDDKELVSILSQHIGKNFYAKRNEDKPSKYVADSSGKKKTMFVFDVYTMEA